MVFKPSLRFSRLKLHTKTTLLVSVVLVVIFAVIAYFSDLALTQLSEQQEQQEAQLLAARVAATVEHHVKRETRRQKPGGRSLAEKSEPAPVPDWNEVHEEIYETVARAYQALVEVRVFFKASSDKWEEKIKILSDGRDHPLPDLSMIPQEIKTSEVVETFEQGSTVFIAAISPAVFAPDGNQPRQIAAAWVLLAFDRSKSSASRLRSMIGPLMILGIIAITLITYYLFRFIVYEPLDGLLMAMSEAEEGNLTIEAKPFAPDEIGMLTSRFNRMLSRIHHMTEQLNLEQRLLEDRVAEATSEIAERKEQLEDANLRLFEIQRQLAQMERLAATGQLAAQFAHEVGTPLNLISGHVQLLRARATDQQVIRRLDVIAGQIDRITNIVRSMLDSTRRPEPVYEAVDLNESLARILDAAQPTLAARKVELCAEMAEELPPVKADPDQLQQVFINLINNSLDAMPDGGKLSVSTSLDGETVVICMADEGGGIARDKIDLIFDPLFTTKRSAGTGLGLTIVKHILQEHGGEIYVDSEAGRGTVFRLRLPIQSSENKVAPAERTALDVADTDPIGGEEKMENLSVIDDGAKVIE